MIHDLCTIEGCLSKGRYCRFPGHQKAREKKRFLLSKVAEPRKDENKIYEKNKKKYLREHAFCQAALEGCTKIAVAIHHIRKRRTEDDRVNPKFFLAVCNHCHEKIEADPAMSYRKKLSVKAID